MSVGTSRRNRNRADLPLKAEINAFQARILSLCGEYADTERVMQLNLQFFPLSRSAEQEGEAVYPLAEHSPGEGSPG